MGMDKVKEEGLRRPQSVQARSDQLPGEQQLLREVLHPVEGGPDVIWPWDASLHVNNSQVSLS